MIQDYDCITPETEMLNDIHNTIKDQIEYNNVTEEYFTFNRKYYKTKQEWMTLFSVNQFTVLDFNKSMNKKLEKLLEKDPLRRCYFAAQKNQYPISSLDM